MSQEVLKNYHSANLPHSTENIAVIMTIILPIVSKSQCIYEDFGAISRYLR